MPIFDLFPYNFNNFIAPNATVIGEVSLQQYSSIWYNVVLRGDINRIYVAEFSSIGDGTVI